MLNKLLLAATPLSLWFLWCCSSPSQDDAYIERPPGMSLVSLGTGVKKIVADTDYTEVHDEWMDADLLAEARAVNMHVVIRRGAQRGQLLVDDCVAMDFPVCLGKPGHATPLGDFLITQKNVDHVSNIYDVDMPYFMRLTDSGIGIHVGPVFRTPASHGCIRMTRSACIPLFNAVKIGTRVKIVE